MLLLVLSLLAAQGPGCDTAGLQVILTRWNAEEASKTPHPEFFSEVLAKNCGKKMSTDLREALQKLPTVPPADRATLAMHAVGTDPSAWSHACPGGTSALAGYVALEHDPKRSKLLFERCKLFALSTEDELNAATGPLPLAILVWDWLKREGIDAPTARAYARGLAGIGSSRPVVPR